MFFVIGTCNTPRELSVKRADGPGLQFEIVINHIVDHYVVSSSQVIWLLVLFVANWQASNGHDHDVTMTTLTANTLGLKQELLPQRVGNAAQHVRWALLATLGLNEPDLEEHSTEEILLAAVLANKLQPTTGQLLAEM